MTSRMRCGPVPAGQRCGHGDDPRGVGEEQDPVGPSAGGKEPDDFGYPDQRESGQRQERDPVQRSPGREPRGVGAGDAARKQQRGDGQQHQRARPEHDVQAAVDRHGVGLGGDRVSGKARDPDRGQDAVGQDPESGAARDPVYVKS